MLTEALEDRVEDRDIGGRGQVEIDRVAELDACARPRRAGGTHLGCFLGGSSLSALRRVEVRERPEGFDDPMIALTVDDTGRAPVTCTTTPFSAASVASWMYSFTS